MRNRNGVLSAGAAALLLAACSEPTTNSGLFARDALTAALASAPAGYGDLSSSYVGIAAEHAAAGDSVGFPGGGRGRRMGGGEMMGGGLGDAFLGGVGFGHGRGHEGPFGGGLGCTGTFDAATGRVTCAETTLRNGLVVNRSAAYTTAAGTVQQAFDSLTTNTVDLRSSVAGTITFTNPDSISGREHHGPRGDLAAADAGVAAHRGPGGGPGGRGHGPGFRLLGDTSRILSATSTIASSSQRTTSGLASGSTQRTVNGTSKGTESTTGVSTRGNFTATRSAADTTTGLVVPVDSLGRRSYPTAGSVVRTMTISLAYEGASPVSLSRREVVTYDGSATAKVEITQDGTTRSCTRALPRGPLVCP